MKCRDADFLVALLRGKSDAKSKMESLDAEGHNATTSFLVGSVQMLTPIGIIAPDGLLPLL